MELRNKSLAVKYTLQMFTGIYRDSAGKSERRDFDFTGILRGFPALDVGKSCNKIFFLDISVNFAGTFCKL